MKTIELLAPAKDKETAIAAVNYGADAVYIGAQQFSAREKAGNSIADIAAVVRHAHLYGAKVYGAVNTLLRDDELEPALKQINELYAVGIDAIIIQDTGLLAADMPPVAIHASTQMHNDTVAKIEFLEKIGVKRVILPRELSLAEIREIRASTAIELEAFIHGALCVSYSGQCYLSYAIGGRSANRGECAQPCRKKYSLKDEQGKLLAQDKYLLSLKDLCLKDQLAALIDAGVSSFKIEGRMKNLHYVKNVVAYYRQAIDRLLLELPNWRKSSSGRVYFDFTPNLAKSFNRSYTNYFINGRQPNITQFNTPKALGELVTNRGDLVPADGVCWIEQGMLKGGYVSNLENIPANVDLYRNYDYKFAKILDASKTARKVSFELTVYSDKLVAVDEDGLRSELELLEPLNADTERIEKAFSKFGDSIFILQNINYAQLATPKAELTKISALNALRRDLMAAMEQTRLKAFLPKPLLRQPVKAIYPISGVDFKGNAINQQAIKFYESNGAKVLEKGAEAGLNLDDREVMVTKHCLRHSFNQCGNNSQPWVLIDDKGHAYKLIFDCQNCVMKVVF